MDSEITWASMMCVKNAVEKILQSSEPNSQNTHIHGSTELSCKKTYLSTGHTEPRGDRITS